MKIDRVMSYVPRSTLRIGQRWVSNFTFVPDVIATTLIKGCSISLILGEKTDWCFFSEQWKLLPGQDKL